MHTAFLYVGVNPNSYLGSWVWVFCLCRSTGTYPPAIAMVRIKKTFSPHSYCRRVFRTNSRDKCSTQEAEPREAPSDVSYVKLEFKTETLKIVKPQNYIGMESVQANSAPLLVDRRMSATQVTSSGSRFSPLHQSSSVYFVSANPNRGCCHDSAPSARSIMQHQIQFN